MATSKIEWTEKTWNPVVGCTKVSPGCKHCYAESMSMRLASMVDQDETGRRRHYLHVINEHGNWNNRVEPVEEPLDDPLKWKPSSMVFVNSMSDLFHKGVSIKFIEKVFDVMRRAHWHQFQVLTKRSQRLLELDDLLVWPENVWMGVSVESNDYIYRIDHLRQTHARIKFLSLEPLLGPIPQPRQRYVLPE